MLKRIIAYCFVVHIVNLSFCQEIIVRFSEDVKIHEEKGESTKHFSSHSDIQNILSEKPPRKLRPLFQQKKNASSFLQNVQLWKYDSEQDCEDVLNRFASIAEVKYAEPNRAFKISETPNDFHFPEQWYLPKIKAPEAWNVEKGREGIIVGVIDTGIDYNHEDLDGQLWINQAEDLNQNGKMDSSDVNGLDEDNNGYIDDVMGWDFTDAPNFPDQGDFLDPDNDPMDEFLTGHGTPIAGIIVAKQNNQIGISGIAPNIKVMNLRAGTASGFLEEDDVAEAIVYAVDNGCKIINMSFGDVAFSYLIRDAILYGQSKGVLFVAASGNSGNSVPQYPASYDETISVGAVTSSNTLAGFSSFGDKLNLVAPGEEIFSCQINDDYGLNNGTSFSAPIVSAIAALVWSHRPNYSIERVKGALYAGCADLGFAGWDIHYGHGIVEVNRSLSISNFGYAEIQIPAVNDGIAMDEVPIIGTAFSPNLISYSLKFGIGENPDKWSLITEKHDTQVVGDTLVIWNASVLADSLYTLELRLQQYSHQDVVYRTQVYIDHTAPVLSSLNETEMLIGPENGVLIDFETDDLTLATIHYGSTGSHNFNRTKTSQYFQRRHYILLSQNNLSGPIDYYIHLDNSSGITSIDDNEGNYYQINIGNAQPVENIFSFKEEFSFSGYLLPLVTDFNLNQKPEIVISRELDTTQYGSLQIWESQNPQFELKSETGFPAIPRDVGDIENDGSVELLAGFGGMSMILEIAEGAQFPDQIAWIDTSNIWGSRLVNLDTDQALELIAIKNEEWSIFDLAIPNFQPRLKQILSNSTDGNNRYGIPWSVVDDFDQDGLREIVVGDYDGDILIFEENDSGFYRVIWSNRLSGIDATHLIQAADVNGDGKTELVTAVRNEPEQHTESTVIARYWHMDIWQAESNNNFVKIWEKNFHGVNSRRSSFNGMSVADINGDNIYEIFFTPFPRAYQIQYLTGVFEIAWYEEDMNTNTVLQSDFDGNGKVDILANTDSGVQRFESGLSANRPLPPAQLTGIPLDTNLTNLNWLSIPNADYYRVYRGISPNYLNLLDSIQTSFYLDSTVHPNQTYFYAVTQVDQSFPQSESEFSEIVSVQPGTPPNLDTLIVLSSRQVLLRFNKPMSDQAFNTNNYFLLQRQISPISAVRGHNRHHSILSFNYDFNIGQNHLILFNLTDRRGTPFKYDTLMYTFNFNSTARPFYLKSAEFISKQHLKLFFSNPVNPGTANRPENYSLEPDGKIVSIEVDTLELDIVSVYLDKNNRMGSLGIPYYIKVNNLEDVFGNGLDNKFGNNLLISRTVQNLNNVIVYPNPYNSNSAIYPLRFANLPHGSEIYIFNASGQFIRKLKEDNEDGGVRWDLNTENNHLIGSGVYFYVVRYQDREVKGKFVIIN